MPAKVQIDSSACHDGVSIGGRSYAANRSGSMIAANQRMHERRIRLVSAQRDHRTKGVGVVVQLYAIYSFVGSAEVGSDSQPLVEVPVDGGSVKWGKGRVDVVVPVNQMYEIKPEGGVVSPFPQLRRYGEASGYLVPGMMPFNGRVTALFDLVDVKYTTTSQPGVIEYDVYPTDKLMKMIFLTMMVEMFLSLRNPMVAVGVASQWSAVAAGAAL